MNTTRRSAGSFLLWLLLLAVGVVGPAEAGGQGSATAKPATHTVVIKSTSYAPQVVTVKRGDTVVWINDDRFPHTVTSAWTFVSKIIAAGGSWKFQPLVIGDFDFTCTFHSNMTGTLNMH